MIPERKYIRQQRAARRKRPPQGDTAVIKVSPRDIDADKSDDPHEGIRETRSEFPDPTYSHRKRLNPHEEGRFLGERLESDLHASKAMSEEHLARSRGKIDLVPVEEMQPSQRGMKLNAVIAAITALSRRPEVRLWSRRAATQL